MGAQNSIDDKASLYDAFQALLRGETLRVRVRNQAERRRLRSAFKRNAPHYEVEAQFRTEAGFLIVRWRKPQGWHQK